MKKVCKYLLINCKLTIGMGSKKKLKQMKVFIFEGKTSMLDFSSKRSI